MNKDEKNENIKTSQQPVALLGAIRQMVGKSWARVTEIRVEIEQHPSITSRHINQDKSL